MPRVQKRVKLKPTGFVAKCQCGVYIGAVDIRRTRNEDVSKLLGKWLFTDGCTVEPRFDGTWMETISPCQCKSIDHQP
jgi:hypothetical protein